MCLLESKFRFLEFWLLLSRVAPCLQFVAKNCLILVLHLFSVHQESSETQVFILLILTLIFHLFTSTFDRPDLHTILYQFLSVILFKTLRFNGFLRKTLHSIMDT